METMKQVINLQSIHTDNPINNPMYSQITHNQLNGAKSELHVDNSILGSSTYLMSPKLAAKSVGNEESAIKSETESESFSYIPPMS